MGPQTKPARSSKHSQWSGWSGFCSCAVLRLVDMRALRRRGSPGTSTRSDHDQYETGCDKEVLALFANPKMPGYQPLSFGQDLKHLLRALPLSDIAIEPAATLEDAQAALHEHRPRIVVFSGHAFGGSLAFEDSKGALDRHGDVELFVRLILGQARPRPARMVTFPR